MRCRVMVGCWRKGGGGEMLAESLVAGAIRRANGGGGNHSCVDVGLFCAVELMNPQRPVAAQIAVIDPGHAGQVTARATSPATVNVTASR